MLSPRKTLEDFNITDDTNVLHINIMYFIFKKVASAPLMASAPGATTVPMEQQRQQTTDVLTEHIMM